MKTPALGLSVVVLAVASTALANGENETRLLRQPTVSATHIAFAYANNIWSVERSGGIARRLTSFQGQTVNPRFSPDGNWLAFSAEYAGNLDVYVMPSEGGEPKRLTWHPGSDTVQGWTHDGAAVVFASGAWASHISIRVISWRSIAWTVSFARSAVCVYGWSCATSE